MSILRFTTLLVTLCSCLVSGCGWIQTLRRDIEDDGESYAQTADVDFYKDPANRFVPPPPANVSDLRTATVAGTPIDLSGVRAKAMRVTAKDFVADNLKNENSLWTEDGQNNYLFARNKLKTPGDLVSVVIEDKLRNDMVGSVKKLLPPEYRDADIRVPGLTKDSDQRTPAAQGATADAAPAPTSNTPGPDDILTAEVLERYPNGNLRLRGVKRVPFKNTVRNIEVVAIVKGADVTESDTVPSSKFFEHRVELYR